jgi:hypothetical protein
VPGDPGLIERKWTPPQESRDGRASSIAQLTAAKVSNPKFRGKVGNSLDISKGICQSGMCKFESSRPSQAVRRSEKVPLILAERPANGGLLRISRRSPGSDFGQSQSETADSLRRTFEKFPFLRDCGRRPGSICTTWPMRQCYVLWFPGRLGMKSGFSDHALRGGRWSVFGRRRSAYGPGRKPRKAGSATKPGTESQSRLFKRTLD